MDIVSAVVTWLTDPAHWSGQNGVPYRLFQHVGISLVSVLIAMAIALPLGLYIGHTRRGQVLAVNLANVGRAIPSLAAIAIVVPFTQMIDPARGFNLYPTVIAMVVLAIPPILVNACAGVAGVDPEVRDAARGVGMTTWQQVVRVEVPIAMPLILVGLRTAAIFVVATATIAAYVGLGGLGRFIIDGLASEEYGPVAGGALLVVVLAIIVLALFAGLSRLVVPAGLRKQAKTD
jgi:osmoprotectant transport system permease protein